MPESQALFQLRSKVEGTLTEAFGELEYGPSGDYMVRLGGAVVSIIPQQAERNIFVWIFSPLVVAIQRATPELLHFMAVHNGNFSFGRFYLSEQEDYLSLDHYLVGESLDGEELRHVIRSLAQTAEALGPQAARLAGGRCVIGLARPR